MTLRERLNDFVEKYFANSPSETNLKSVALFGPPKIAIIFKVKSHNGSWSHGLSARKMKMKPQWSLDDSEAQKKTGSEWNLSKMEAEEDAIEVNLFIFSFWRQSSLKRNLPNTMGNTTVGIPQFSSKITPQNICLLYTRTIIMLITNISSNFTIRTSWTWRGLKTIHLPFLRESVRCTVCSSLNVTYLNDWGMNWYCEQYQI